MSNLDEGWNAESLRGLDLLVLPTDSTSRWSENESSVVQDFLERGGGVFVFGIGDVPATPEGDSSFPLPRLRQIHAPIGSPRPEPESHILAQDLVSDVDPDHPAVRIPQRVFLHRPRQVEYDDGAMTPVVRHEGATLIGTVRLGEGRLAVVGNGEMFLLPFLGRESNAELFLDLVQWAAKGTTSSTQWSALDVTVKHRYPTRVFAEGEDLEQSSGSHLIDARPFEKLLSPLAFRRLPHPYEDESTFLTEAELAYHEMPRPIRQAVTRFRLRSNAYGVLLIKGLPTDPFAPRTPADPGERIDKKTWLSELWLAAFGSALGFPFAYRQEKRGQLFQNVAPTPHNATKLSSESSALLLDFHTETAFHPHMPDYVLLHCIRPDHERVAKTIGAGIRMILPELSLRDRGLLFEPLYRTGIDYSFGSANGFKGNGPLLPVLSGDPYDPHLTFDLDLMTGLTPEAEIALRNLAAATRKVQRWVRLDAGDLLIVDNRKAVHARSEFTARYDGLDRWLQRMCVLRSPFHSASDRRLGSHVVETRFAV
ncbi:TauD/TfdA family dioxygenase [Streptosporangium subroseum]|uniref:TauD/TfdA family dioxygenase n=1 Tax=Streptosporangium subroseum TaxID=106412 RepID=UPI003085F890|nr:TauD/TfdA family dioxygenase [Streptosporangium subroseum]